MGKGRRRLLAVLALVAIVAAGCGGDDGGSADGGSSAVEGDPSTLRVPEDFDTIQDAVDAADPGSLILVGPCTYEEDVNVTPDDLVSLFFSRFRKPNENCYLGLGAVLWGGALVTLRPTPRPLVLAGIATFGLLAPSAARTAAWPSWGRATPPSG